MHPVNINILLKHNRPYNTSYVYHDHDNQCGSECQYILITESKEALITISDRQDNIQKVEESNSNTQTDLNTTVFYHSLLQKDINWRLCTTYEGGNPDK
jgi:hypothetical protein